MRRARRLCDAIVQVAKDSLRLRQRSGVARQDGQQPAERLDGKFFDAARLRDEFARTRAVAVFHQRAHVERVSTDRTFRFDAVVARNLTLDPAQVALRLAQHVGGDGEVLALRTHQRVRDVDGDVRH